ncbi:hypothetical protein [Polaribacter sp.]|uniref:hypothetical protein n=1 Tax=Polaribacter sp. TaxID=1920175 RepID=UPI003F6A8946
MKVINTFTKGVMNKSTDKSLVPQDMFIDAENLRFSTTQNNDEIGTNIKGTLMVSDSTDDNDDYKCICATFNKKKDTILYFLATTNGQLSKIVEYDTNTEITTDVTVDTRGVLNFDKNGYITGVNVIDDLLVWSEWGNNIRRINIERAKNYGENGFEEEDITLIVKPPHDKPQISLQDLTKKNVLENNIEEKFICFAYRWRYLDGEYSAFSPFTLPAFEPKTFEYDFSVQSNESMINKYNQVEIGFDTGGKNVTEIQLVFKESGDNEAFIINDFVKGLMDDGVGWGDNEIKTFYFSNFNSIRGLSKNELRKLFDNVPREALGQTMIDGRLLFAHYKENYDIIDDVNNKINIDYTLELDTETNQIRKSSEPTTIEYFNLEDTTHISTPSSFSLTIQTEISIDIKLYEGDPIALTGENAGSYTITSVSDKELILTKNQLPYPDFSGEELITELVYLEYDYTGSLIPEKTAKSNRDYEVVIQYLDEYLRGTTLLKSLNNTLFIPSKYSVNKNSIDVILKNKAPYFAKYYRFFIKQSKRGYDQVLPTLFYEDGVYRWIKLDGADKDKVKEGDFLIVKSDTQGVLNNLKKIKVLEVKSQEKNFLQPDDVTDTIEEQSGLYFKIKPDGFRLNVDDYENFEISTYHNARRKYHNPIKNGSNPIIGILHSYATGLDDLQANTGSPSTLSSMTDKRITIEIVSTNSFRWSENDGSTWSSSITITANSAQSITNGLELTFGSANGYTSGDTWNIYLRGGLITENEKAYGFFRTQGQLNATRTDANHTLEDEIIEAGSVITLEYDEWNRGDVYFNLNIVSSARYDNIQEWYYKENVGDKILTEFPDFDLTKIYFMRGVLRRFESRETTIDTGFGNISLWSTGSASYLEYNEDGYMTMVVESQNSQSSFKWVYVRASTTLFQSDGNSRVIFETEPKKTSSDIFYEIGKTYKIQDGLHLGSDNGYDINQIQTKTTSIDLKVKLDWFNAFSYGNGVESYKIKDEFNAKGIDLGSRVSSISKEEYKEVVCTEDITWSDVYSDDASFNGLNSFNLSLENFITLDRENGSIQKIYNKNGNLIVLQEDGIGRIPYNKNIIYDTQGGSVVGISKNILDKKSYSSYGAGKHGISKNPESFISDGFRDYFTDKQRGSWLRLSNDGITPINQNFYDKEFSELMITNKNNKLISGFDPKHNEILLHTPSNNKCLVFKEREKGFSNSLTFSPDFILNANDELYSWKNGVMYKHNATDSANEFYGVKHDSKIKFVVNHHFGFEKIFKSLGIYSTIPWFAKLKTRLSSREIPLNSYRKINDYWYSEIMGDTSDNIENNSIFGIGTYPIINGVISVLNIPTSLSVGDYIRNKATSFAKSKVLEINKNTNEITLEDNISESISFLIYEKNQNIDGGNIFGDFMEVELSTSEENLIEIRSIKTEIDIINK